MLSMVAFRLLNHYHLMNYVFKTCSSTNYDIMPRIPPPPPPWGSPLLNQTNYSFNTVPVSYKLVP